MLSPTLCTVVSSNSLYYQETYHYVRKLIFEISVIQNIQEAVRSCNVR